MPVSPSVAPTHSDMPKTLATLLLFAAPLPLFAQSPSAPENPGRRTSALPAIEVRDQVERERGAYREKARRSERQDSFPRTFRNR